jgi:hypothetical protein
MFVHRRKRKESGYVIDHFTDISAKDVQTIGLTQLSQLVQDSPNIPCLLFCKHDDREFKKQIKVMSNFHRVGKKTIMEDPELTSHFRSSRKLLALTDLEDASIKKDDLWSIVGREFLAVVRPFIMSQLLPYQQQVITNLTTNKGVLGKLAIISGPGGSGKTNVALFIAAAFLGHVMVTEPSAKRRTEDRDDFLKQCDNRLRSVELGSDVDDSDGDEDTWKESVIKEAEFVPTVKQLGKVLLVSPTNVSVDSVVEKAKVIFDKVCEHAGVPKVAVIRLHSITTENQAIIPQIDPLWNNGPKALNTLDMSIVVENELAELIQSRYIRAHQAPKYRDIFDTRFNLVMCSNSRYVLEMAGVHPMSLEIESLFTKKELKVIEAELNDLFLAQEAFNDCGGKLTPEWRKRIGRVAKVGMRILLEHARVVACTTSVMLESNVYKLMQPHIIICNKMARDHESKTAGLFSMFPTTERYVLVGDPLQSSLLSLVNDRAVVFKNQQALPLFTRFLFGGFPA